jgi:8-oxo-dGTP pyrophosphatase MutT (NUDIX family)
MDPDDILEESLENIKTSNDVPFTNDDVAEITNDYVKNNWEDKKITADGVVMRINDNSELEVLVIKRKRGPHRNEWALPGGIQDNETLQLFAEADLHWTAGVNDRNRTSDRLFGLVNTNQDRVRMTMQFTALKELLEEVGLDPDEILTKVSSLTPKYNRFDWDARATSGVSVGGTFVYIYDNDWNPKAGDDAIKAEWKTVDSILNGDTKLAFGHSEWITQVLEDKKLILDTPIHEVFDDNPKYLYGIDKPKNTLGTYQTVINKLRKINKNNKSNITQLIEAANIVREEKGMSLIPVDRSNIQGSAESIIKNMRLNFGNPILIQKEMQPKQFLEYITVKNQSKFRTDLSDYEEEEFLKQINEIHNNLRMPGQEPTTLTMEDILQRNFNTDINGEEFNVKLNEKGIDNVARQMQNNMLKSVEEKIISFHRMGFEDDVILDELRTLYKENLDTNEFYEYLVDYLKDNQDSKILDSKINLRPLAGFTTMFSEPNIYGQWGGRNKTAEYLTTDKQLNFLNDILGNEFMTMDPIDFFKKYGESKEPPLNQKSSYIENGVLHFQTNHGTPGPSESVLNFINEIEKKHGDDLNYENIAEGLKSDRPVFFDDKLSFVDPTIGKTGLVGPVLYTTTSPFIGASYGTGSADGITPDQLHQVIKEDIARYIAKNFDDSEIVNDVIEIGKQNGIFIDLVFDPQYPNRKDLVEVVIKDINNNDMLATANVANIRGKVNQENILKLNHSVLPGQGDPKLQNFWKEVMSEFDENWFIRDLENATNFVKGEISPEYRDPYNRNKLVKDMIPYVALQKTRPIPGAVDRSKLENIFKDKVINDPDYKPNFGEIVGTGGNLSGRIGDRDQNNFNYKYLLDQIQKGAPVVGFEDQEAYKHIAKTLDEYHKYFQAGMSLDMQLLSDYIKASLAIDAEDYTTAGKLLGIDFLEGEWVPRAGAIADAIELTIEGSFKDSLINYQNTGNYSSGKIGSSVYKIQNDIKAYLYTTDLSIEPEWNKNYNTVTRVEKLNNFYKENNLPAKVKAENIDSFFNTVASYDVSGNSTDSYDKTKLDRKIYTMAGNNGYEITLSSGGGFVGDSPHWVVGIIDPSNKLNTNKPKSLEVEVVDWAYMDESEADNFYSLRNKDVQSFTDEDLRVLTKFANVDNVLDLNPSEDEIAKFDQAIKKQGVYMGYLDSMTSMGKDNVSVQLMLKQKAYMETEVAYKLGQVPIEEVIARANDLTTTLATASEEVRAKFYTGAVNTMTSLNKYAKPGLQNSLKYGGKAIDTFDKWVLAPAAIDILASRMSGSGSQYETIGGALVDTIDRYEDDKADTVIEMLYGNKNNPEAKNLLGVNVAYPVTQGIEYGKDKFKEYIYDNNVFGIKSMVEYIKPKAIEELKGIVNITGLNDWVYKVKRDMTVEMLMKQNNVPYTKENIDIYTKAYEENNPKQVDRFGKELSENYDQSWVSSMPENYLATSFRVDERIRTGDRNTAGGGGSGVVQE